MDIGKVEKSFNTEGYCLLTKEYKNQDQKLEYICPNGHKRSTTWKNWKRGRRCLLCKNQSTKPTIDVIKTSFEKEGYILLSKRYINNKTKLDYICSVGHKNSITWADWNSGGYRCPDCANNKKLSLEVIKKDFASEGYEFLSGEYKNNTSLLLVRCPKGHEFTTNRVRWTHGNRCSVCHKNRVNIDKVRFSFENEGYTLLSTEYVNAHAKLDFICSNGHEHSITWAAWQQGERCFYCGKAGTSLQEQELIDYVKSLGVYVETHDRYLIKPYELDIVIPDKKIAIEYCGLYWHSELAGKDSKYHVNKLEMCERAGYRLLTIFEDEFVNKRDIVLTRINHILNIGSARKIYARKCTIKEIPTDLVSDFCNKFHLQGYAGSSIKIGAFYEDRLVSIMTFSKPSIYKGGLDRNNDVWELSRFCSDSGFIVVGVASKLLNFFKKHYVWKSIFSYADRRWSDGNLYKTIGFNFIGNTATSYWYIKKGHIERKHRFMFRKKKDEPLNRTEWSLRKEQGLDRIWDCGNLKYVMHRI